jgi:hypothetical protein
MDGGKLRSSLPLPIVHSDAMRRAWSRVRARLEARRWKMKSRILHDLAVTYGGGGGGGGVERFASVD